MRFNRQVARANPFSDRTVSGLPTDGAETDLLHEIVATSTADPLTDTQPVLRHSSRRRGFMTVTTAAAAAAVVALGGVLILPRGDDPATAPPTDQPEAVGTSSAGSGPAATAKRYRYASAVIAVAEANQRLLLNAPGWRISYVGDFGVDSGEITFKNPASGPSSAKPPVVTYTTPGEAGSLNGKAVYDTGQFKDLDLSWYPAKDYRSYYSDRANGNPSKPIELLGQKGTMFQYAGTTDFTTILPPKGKNFVEIRGNFGSEQAYRDLVGKLYKADVQTWLDALPESVVKPEQVKKVVDEMLAGLPLPNGFDKQKLYDRGVTTERYHVGARVAGAVTCAWVDRWIKARNSGDTAVARQAVDALKSSRSWKVLQEMNAQGNYPEVVWEIADQVVSGEMPGGDKGKGSQAPDAHKQALGCD